MFSNSSPFPHNSLEHILSRHVSLCLGDKPQSLTGWRLPKLLRQRFLKPFSFLGKPPGLESCWTGYSFTKKTPAMLTMIPRTKRPSAKPSGPLDVGLLVMQIPITNRLAKMSIIPINVTLKALLMSFPPDFVWICSLFYHSP